MIYKLTSVKTVIAKVFTDLDLQEETHRISDMVEWSGEALEKIGAFPSFTNVVTGQNDVPLLEVSNYISKLPCDFHSVIQIAYSATKSGPFFPMRYGTSSFENVGDPYTSTDDVLDTTPAISDVVTLAMTLYSLDYDDALTYLNSHSDIKTQLENILSDSYSNRGLINNNTTDPLHTTSDLTYIINNGYIKCNISSGYLMMAYQGIPVDSDGYPMIPDDISFKEAIYWYITMKLLYPKWAEGRIRDQVYFDARRSWNFYCNQAYGNAMMPNIDKLESIKNAWLRLIPEINEHRSGFGTLGQEQIIYNHNNSWEKR